MKTPTILLAAGAVAVCSAMLFVPAADGYDRWSIDDDATNCRRCHGDFRAGSYVSPSDGQDWGNLHNLHRFDMLDGDCATCHQAEFFPVLMEESQGGIGFPAISCGGCHGRDEDMGNTSGRSAGMRQHHFRAGITECLDCHEDSDPDNYTPVGEDVAPAYYFQPDPDHANKPTNPCNPAGEENYAGLANGLDNDGNSSYDGDDPACASCVEGGDTDGNGCVEFADILVVLAAWGGGGPEGDADCSGVVDFADILVILASWDEGCP